MTVLMCARVNKSELFSCKQERFLTFDPYIIILGDAGINFSGAEYDSRKKGMLASLPITIMVLWTLSYRKEN